MEQKIQKMFLVFYITVFELLPQLSKRYNKNTYSQCFSKEL